MSIVDNLNMEQNLGDKDQGEFVGSLAMPSDYFVLLKPRVMSLVVFTALVGLMLAPSEIHPLVALVAIAAIASARTPLSYRPDYRRYFS